MPDRASLILDEHLAAKQAVGRPSVEPFRGSLLGSCLRRQLYEAYGEPHSNEPDAEALRTFERGHVVAEVLDRALAAHPDVAMHAREVRVRWPEQHAAGNADEVVIYEDAQAEVWEVKSVKDYALKYLQGPKPEHAVQAVFYRMRLRDQLQFPADVRIVYASADSFRIREFALDPTPWENIVHRILRALNYYYADRRQAPRLRFAEGLDPRRTWPCNYCAYLDTCRPKAVTE